MPAPTVLTTAEAVPAMRKSAWSDLVEALGTVAFFAAACVGFFALVAALFQLGLFSSVSILFYRCIAVTAVASVLFAVAMIGAGRRHRFCGTRDAIAATLVAASMTITFLTLGPVTVDRSISIFINGHMAAAPDRVFTAGDIDRAFRDRYLTGMNQIARRMEEQRITGTLERVGDGYRITGKGRALIATSRTMAILFGADQRLLDGPEPTKNP